MIKIIMIITDSSVCCFSRLEHIAQYKAKNKEFKQSQKEFACARAHTHSHVHTRTALRSHARTHARTHSLTHTHKHIHIHCHNDSLKR